MAKVLWSGYLTGIMRALKPRGGSLLPWLIGFATGTQSLLTVLLNDPYGTRFKVP
jgi:hypothetical protein